MKFKVSVCVCYVSEAHLTEPPSDIYSWSICYLKKCICVVRWLALLPVTTVVYCPMKSVTDQVLSTKSVFYTQDVLKHFL
jgi:hypothetical protein